MRNVVRIFKFVSARVLEKLNAGKRVSITHIHRFICIFRSATSPENEDLYIIAICEARMH